MPTLLPDLALMALLGLVFGSFLNVLIHRLPIMIEQSWTDPQALGSLRSIWHFLLRTAPTAGIPSPGTTTCRCSVS